jgi:hypothetical protein
MNNYFIRVQCTGASVEFWMHDLPQEPTDDEIFHAMRDLLSTIGHGNVEIVDKW